MRYIWAEIARTEQIIGWLALSFAVTMAIGNPKNVLWKIAEHGAGRAGWVVVFSLTGVLLLLGPKLIARRGHFFLCSVSAMFWAFFAAQAWSIGAIGASMIGLICAGYMVHSAHHLHRG